MNKSDDFEYVPHMAYLRTGRTGTERGRNDRVWQEFLDVLTGKKSWTEAPTIEELNTQMERDEEC